MTFKTLALAGWIGTCCSMALGAEWSMTWSAAPGDPAPEVQITALKYGKEFAYAVEIDDCPASTLAVVQPLLAKQQFTDAPPGVAGGKPMPFVGTSAVMVVRLGGNETYLSADDLKQLQSLGWGVANHSYWHAGRTYGNPPEILTDEQIKSDLFWSQSVLAKLTPDGRAPSHFVYPNGYTAYNTQLKSFGLHSASRVSGSNRSTVEEADFKLLDLNRNYLDEGAWKSYGKESPMHDFPDEPAHGQVVIDFTHNIDADESSANHQRWATRLKTIAERFGQGAKDSIWCAPSGEIFEYVQARRAAKVTPAVGSVTVTIPDDAPGAALTLKLMNVPEAVEIKAPEGGASYRSGTTVWVTTPQIGSRGAPAPTPVVTCAYEGEAKSMTFPGPVKIAGVRLLQKGEVTDASAFKLDAVGADGTTTSLLAPGTEAPAKAWGVWKLYDVVPNRPAVEATGLNLNADRAFTKMEVWVTP